LRRTETAFDDPRAALLEHANRVRDVVLRKEARAARNPYLRSARARRARLERQARGLRTAQAAIDPKPWERPEGMKVRFSAERRPTPHQSKSLSPASKPGETFRCHGDRS
jgi:hypothetical protein